METEDTAQPTAELFEEYAQKEMLVCHHCKGRVSYVEHDPVVDDGRKVARITYACDGCGERGSLDLPSVGPAGRAA